MLLGRPQELHLPPNDRRGFTLIELLVVIAIIALLIAILLPSLEASRRQAKQTVCISRIKNIATSSRVYEADDPQGWGIPVHPAQFTQDGANPTYVGAYEWGGKSGVGRPGYSGFAGEVGSKYGTHAGFGPATRAMNDIIYKSRFSDYREPFDRIGAQRDAMMDLDAFRCPGDDGPPRGGHCPDWVNNPDQSSYDHFGNSYAANVFMVTMGFTTMFSNSPYMRPTSRIPTPGRTLYYEENVGRWAWAARQERCDNNPLIKYGVDPGPTKAIRGWHGRDWTYTRAFVDGHAETQRILIEGTQDRHGYFRHYEPEWLASYPALDVDGDGIADTDSFQGTASQFWGCIIIRGPGWQKDTLPAAPIPTHLQNRSPGRPSYEDCVWPSEG